MRYFLYARKSTDDEDRQILSIEGQLVELREYAKRENLSIIKEFVEAKTAKAPGRPIFNDMLRQIEQGSAEGILAWHPDRLARNSVDGGKIIYLIDQDTLKIAILRRDVCLFVCLFYSKIKLFYRTFSMTRRKVGIYHSSVNTGMAH